MTGDERLAHLAVWHWGGGGSTPDSCGEAECSVCAILLCPSAEPLHFDDDGCPACSRSGSVSIVEWRQYYRAVGLAPGVIKG